MDFEAPADPALVRTRGRRLEWILTTLAVCAAGMLASLALPWSTVTVPETMMNTGSTTVALQGGTVTFTGRELGMVEPVLVAVGLLAVGAFFAYRTWWWASGLLTIVVVSRVGFAIPMPGARGSTSLAAAGQGLELIRIVWPLSFAMLALATVQAYLVRQAAHAKSDTTGDVRAVLRRVLGAAWTVAAAARPDPPEGAGDERPAEAGTTRTSP